MPDDRRIVASRGARVAYPLKAGLTRARSAAWLVRSRGRGGTSGLRILMYHRVSRARDELAVSPRRFGQQMELLAAEGYRAVTVSEAAELLASGAAPPRTVGLSFDDGYLDVAENAVPVLAVHGFSATVFVATGVVDGGAFPTWYKRPPPLLGWDEIVELQRGGVLEFWAHTVTHPNLLALEGAEARAEIAGSKTELEARLGRPVTLFAYPAGLFGRRERRLVAEAGFRFAVSCEPGVNLPTTDRFALRRRQIDARDSMLDFRAKVAGGHDTPPPLRGTYRRFRYGAGRDTPTWAS